jgi:hypothetical protein
MNKTTFIIKNNKLKLKVRIVYFFKNSLSYAKQFILKNSLFKKTYFMKNNLLQSLFKNSLFKTAYFMQSYF